MTRRLLLIGLLAGASLAIAQDSGSAAAAGPGSSAGAAAANGEHKAAGDEGKWLYWKWANFAILAALLGYLIAKNSGPFFRGRTERIQKDMAESGRLREEAEKRAKEMESRLAALGSEIEKLRSSAKAEFTAEGERIRQETERRLKRIQQQTEQEVGLITKAAIDELRATAARLAVDLAEARIRAGMDKPTQSRLVNAFVGEVGGPETRQ